MPSAATDLKEVTDDIPVRARRTDTPFDPENAPRIKANIRRIWERVAAERSLKQSDLAAALKLSQSAVSKLLRDSDGHPWTVGKILTFSEFAQVSIGEIIDNNPNLFGFFYGWTSDRSHHSREIMEQSREAVGKYYTARGRNIAPTAQERLATAVAVRVSRTDRGPADFEQAIRDAILDMAGRD